MFQYFNTNLLRKFFFSLCHKLPFFSAFCRKEKLENRLPLYHALFHTKKQNCSNTTSAKIVFITMVVHQSLIMVLFMCFFFFVLLVVWVLLNMLVVKAVDVNNFQIVWVCIKTKIKTKTTKLFALKAWLTCMSIKLGFYGTTKIFPLLFFFLCVCVLVPRLNCIWFCSKTLNFSNYATMVTFLFCFFFFGKNTSICIVYVYGVS